MRVALLSFNFGQYCIRLANGLAEQAEVLLLAPRELSEPYRFGLDPRVELHSIDLPRLRQPIRQARMVRSVVRRINAFGPDVIHYQAGHMWFNLVWPFYRGYPLVVTIHESRHHAGDRDSQKTPQWIMNLGYRRADRIVVHGEQIRRAVIAEHSLPDRIIDAVPAVPDIVLGDGAVPERADDDRRSVLFFGRIWAYKGLEFLIRAEPLITERIPDARIVIAGRGEELARYRAMMAHPDRFEIHNEYISDADLVDHFRRAAVVVLPYVEASISGVVAVAYTFGKPVVATDVGILAEMVEHGRTGLIVPPRDERALADAIVQLLGDEKLRREFGEHARVRVQSVYDPVTVGRQTVAVYKRAIAGRTR